VAEESKDPADPGEDEHLDIFVPGSRYRVYSRSDREDPLVSTGQFLGFTSFGSNDQGLRIELGEEHGDDVGVVRILPMPNVLYLEVLEQKRRPPSQRREEEHHAVFYT
jgi:hypothetical protein